MRLYNWIFETGNERGSRLKETENGDDGAVKKGVWIVVVCKSCADDAACGDVSQTTTFRCWITAKCFVRSFVLSFFCTFPLFLFFFLFTTGSVSERPAIVLVSRTVRGSIKERPSFCINKRSKYRSENCTVAFLFKPLRERRSRNRAL